MSGAPIGVLVMAYGTADGPDDIGRYYTDIRGGRPPAPEHLRELRERYARIGNRFPLLDITQEQAAGLEGHLNAADPDRDPNVAAPVPGFRTYLGMKHSPPFVPEGVAQMRRDGIQRAVGIVMAPHWSSMSIESYVERVKEVVAREGGPGFTFVRSFHDHPRFVELLASRVAEAMETLPEEVRGETSVIFSAHSLPVRTLEDGSQRCKTCRTCEASCRYHDGLHETAELVAGRLGLTHFTTGWQSAGRTPDPWWGPPIEEVIVQQARDGRRGVVVCSAGFVADHLEILYDLDVEARELAERQGLAFARTRMPNADPAFTGLLADVIRAHLEAPARS